MRYTAIAQCVRRRAKVLGHKRGGARGPWMQWAADGGARQTAQASQQRWWSDCEVLGDPFEGTSSGRAAQAGRSAGAAAQS